MRDVGRDDLHDDREAGLFRSLNCRPGIRRENGKGDWDPRFVQDLLGLNFSEKSPALAASVIDYFGDGHAPTGRSLLRGQTWNRVVWSDGVRTVVRVIGRRWL